MSGHSKWATIKRAKAVTDAKRSSVFTKFANNIAIAAREGADPTTNFKLRMAIDKAKEFNLPKDNIDRAIKRGSGADDGQQLEEITYEGFGPVKIAMMVQCLTDNRNRTASTIKHIFTNHGGNVGAPGSVAWMFEKKGVITIDPVTAPDREKMEMQIIESGADDMHLDEEEIVVYTNPMELQKVKEALEKFGVKIKSAEISMLPKEKINLEENEQEKLEKMIDELDECDDVVNYYLNAE